MMNLLRQAWEKHCAREGFLAHTFSSGLSFHVSEDKLALKKRVSWGRQGERRNSMLRGVSRKKIWEYGVSVIPSLFPYPHMRLKGRVLFSDIGERNKPIIIPDTKAQFRLRRSVCSGWRNKAWHGRVMAFMELLAGESPYVGLPVGSGSTITLDAMPIQFTAPVTARQTNRLFVVPETVFETCRPVAGQRRKLDLVRGELSRRQKGRADLPLLAGVIDDTLEAVFDDIPDFHRQIKAKLLKLGMTSQLIRETTLAPNQFLNKAGYPKRGTQDAATVAWNLATGLFYKTQAEPPWKIAGMRPGVCYVGLVFKLLPNHPDNHACCAAQMFLSEGDGVVFRGANGPWQTEDKEFHLSDSAAEKLIKTVLDTYKLRFGNYPSELFIHGRTKFNDAEWEAFSKAAPAGTNVVGVRIRSTHGETKLFRDGDYPCLRGTAIKLGEKDAFLWTTGYAPRIDTYIGPETPNPLFVTVLRSSGEFPAIDVVLADILGLRPLTRPP